MTLPQPPAFTFGPVTRTHLVRYAGASGDFNPLHHDDDFARGAGLPGVMAHGMLSAGLLASFLSACAGDRFVRRYKVRFKAPVWPGDVLTADGAVTGSGPDGAATVSLSLRRQDGTEVVTGSAEIAEAIP